MSIKVFKSSDYNYVFDDKDGFFARWGRTKEDDPEYSKFGPEILDIEVSTICSNGCSFCYKSNTKLGKNMTFETFKKMFDKFPVTLTQIAFGIGDVGANPDLFKIMKYSRDQGIIPNITIHGNNMTPRYYQELSDTCGAVAVSLYDRDICYDTVERLSQSGMKQVNIHCLLSEETLASCHRVLLDSKTDKRLKNLNAVVFLWVKPKGSRNKYHQVNINDFRILIQTALLEKVNFGMDSCSASNFLKVLRNSQCVLDAVNLKYDDLYKLVEPCESTLFSYYINVDGKGFPCSFTEGSKYQGTDPLDCSDFIKDIWNHPETLKFRDKVINNKDDNNCRMCPAYQLGGVK